MPIHYLAMLLTVDEVLKVEAFIRNLILLREVPFAAEGSLRTAASELPLTIGAVSDNCTETRLPSTCEEFSLVAPPSSPPFGFLALRPGAAPSQERDGCDQEQEGILNDFFCRLAAGTEARECRDFERRCEVSEMESAAACVLQHVVRTRLASRKEAIEK
jgi:hypothetical protein